MIKIKCQYRKLVGVDNGNPLIINGILQNVENGIQDSDGATVGQTVQKSGDTMTGDLNVNGQISVNGNTHSDNIYSRNEITARSIISTGVNANGNSAIQFNYMNGLEGVIFFDNTEKDFFIDRTSSIDPNEENLRIFHEGNFDPDSKEDNLGNPSTDNEVLTSLVDGTRQWKTVQDSINDMLKSTTLAELKESGSHKFILQHNNLLLTKNV